MIGGSRRNENENSMSKKISLFGSASKLTWGSRLALTLETRENLHMLGKNRVFFLISPKLFIDQTSFKVSLFPIIDVNVVLSLFVISPIDFFSLSAAWWSGGKW